MLHTFLQPNILSICKQCVSRTNVHHHRRCISFIAKATPNPFAFKFEALEDIDDVQKLSSNINISDEVMEKIV